MRAWTWALVIFVGIVAVQYGVGKATERAVALPNPTLDTPLASARSQQTAVLAGGCFWGTQAVFQHVKGVIKVTAGYSGGEADTAHYDMVGSRQTGHAESVQIIYDPSQITFGQILRVYFSVVHDPTQLNRQGPDYGTQYRSAVFYFDNEQQQVAKAYIAQLDTAKVFSQRIVTEIVAFHAFYPAEAYHQDYLKNHPNSPYICANDKPKLENLKKQFPDLYRAN